MRHGQGSADSYTDNSGRGSPLGIFDEQDSYLSADLVSTTGCISIYRRDCNGDGVCRGGIFGAAENRKLVSVDLRQYHLHRFVLRKRREIRYAPLRVLPRSGS